MRARPLLALTAALACALAGCAGPAPNVPPTAHASASTAQAAVGDEVVFTGTGFDPDGSVVRYDWDFNGDGVVDFTNATRGAAPFTFRLPGTYLATLTVTDDRGATAVASVQVTVIARFTVSADWGDDEGFLVHAPPGLDDSKVEVTVVQTGVNGSLTFRTGAGLAVLDPTTLRCAVAPSSLTRNGVVQVNVSYNGTPGGDRSFRAVPYFGSQNDSTAVFSAAIGEVRNGAGGVTALNYTGTLTVNILGVSVLSTFAGTGTSNATSRDAGTNTTADYAFSSAAWNQSVGRDNGTFTTVDFEWTAEGTLVSTSPDGFTTNLSISPFLGTRFKGNLTFERAEGTGNYTGPIAGTAGSVAYSLLGNTQANALDGNGVQRHALAVHENLTYSGSYGGAPYLETNLTDLLTAASDTLVNNDFYASWNTSGQLGTTDLNGTGSRYLDSDGNGLYNPDPRPLLASDGQYFVGLAPDELREGDAFTVRNPYGASAKLSVGAVKVEVLVAAGFGSPAVDVVTVAGPVGGGGFGGALAAEVVADGEHSGLRAFSREDLTAPSGSFSSELHLVAKGP